jgi:flagellar motor switch protein FliN/FliY
VDDMATTQERVAEVSETGTNPAISARPARFAPLQPESSISSSTNLDLLLGVTLRVAVELGRTKMSIEEILKLGPGSVVELEKLAGEPVDVMVNDRLIARGEVVVIDDRFGVRITDIFPPAQRINSLK